jgi:SAM-dependent methyltransferase
MSVPPSAVAPPPDCVATPNFDHLAGIYRWLEWISFGPRLSWCRRAFLRLLPHCRRALILGDGDGRFTARLLAQNPALQVDAVDASPAMLSELLRRAGPHACRVKTHLADARFWNPPRTGYDLVVTHFFLDCLTTAEVATLAARLQFYMRPGALWVLSDFAVPAGWLGPFVAQPLIAFLYWAFGLLTGLKIRRLPDYRHALAASGFALIRQQYRLAGLLVSEMWQLRIQERTA